VFRKYLTSALRLPGATAWDLVHHVRGHPIIPFAHDSSLGCAICDPVIAVWCLAGGPSVTNMLCARTTRERSTSSRPFT